MSNDHELIQAGLSPTLVSNLIEQNIDSVKALCSYKLDDLEKLHGVGAASLVLFAKIKESHNTGAAAAGIVAAQPDEPPINNKPAAEPKYMTKEPPLSKRTKVSKKFEVELRNRHASWVERAAEIYGLSEEQIIEQAVRAAYAKDPYRSGGDVANSGSVKKHDLAEWQKNQK